MNTFDPFDPTPDYEPIARIPTSAYADHRHAVGNITARQNRRPLRQADYRALMAAPKGR